MAFDIKHIRFSVLLLLTVLMIFAIPFLRGFIRLKLLLDIFISLILIAAILTTDAKKSTAIIVIALALVYLLLTWIQYLFPHDFLAITANMVGILLFGLVIYSILDFVLRSETVTREVIFAAIVSYLLIAVIWAFGYSSLEIFYPDSFKIPEAMNPDGRGFELFYFSFVTITTLGYGDITPVTDQAQAVAIVEALVGQIYLVVLVAWLVGMHVSRKSR